MFCAACPVSDCAPSVTNSPAAPPPTFFATCFASFFRPLPTTDFAPLPSSFPPMMVGTAASSPEAMTALPSEVLPISSIDFVARIVGSRIALPTASLYSPCPPAIALPAKPAVIGLTTPPVSGAATVPIAAPARPPSAGAIDVRRLPTAPAAQSIASPKPLMSRRLETRGATSAVCWSRSCACCSSSCPPSRSPAR